MNSNIVVYIDQIKLLVPTAHYKTVFQVCALVDRNLPHFCYNKNLVIAGNCRICLVEIQGAPKPVVACATPVTDNMIIFTKSPLLLKARESVMEFMLINHPLDCPICDRGGECDLQDLSILEGRDISRFYIKKRSSSDKNFTPFIKTKMTRCIHCTKCVRLSFLLGVDSMGVGARGNNSEIFDYKAGTKNTLPVASNIIDICPVNWSL